MTDQLLGPLGLLVGALAAVGFLARELLKQIAARIAELTAGRDRAEAREKVALEGWSTQSAVTKELATASKELAAVVMKSIEERDAPP